jgi:lysozyme
MNQIAVDLAKRWEGYRQEVYLCPAGIPTSGYGHAWQGGSTPRPLSPGEAEEMLACDLLVAQSAMYRLSPCMVFESEERQAAIIDFIFNLGSGNYQASTLKRKINAGEWEDTPYQIRRWVYAAGKKLKGLMLRREAEAQLLSV